MVLVQLATILKLVTDLRHVGIGHCLLLYVAKQSSGCILQGTCRGGQVHG